jgi:hypothetical protein
MGLRRQAENRLLNVRRYDVAMILRFDLLSNVKRQQRGVGRVRTRNGARYFGIKVAAAPIMAFLAVFYSDHLPAAAGGIISFSRNMAAKMRRPPVPIIQGVMRRGPLELRRYTRVNPDTARRWTGMVTVSPASRIGAGGETHFKVKRRN